MVVLFSQNVRDFGGRYVYIYVRRFHFNCFRYLAYIERRIHANRRAAGDLNSWLNECLKARKLDLHLVAAEDKRRCAEIARRRCVHDGLDPGGFVGDRNGRPWHSSARLISHKAGDDAPILTLSEEHSCKRQDGKARHNA